MVADQEQFFDAIGVDTKIGMRYQTENKDAHVWLILPYDIPFECTNLCIAPFNHKPDNVFESVSEIIYLYPDAKENFATSD